MGIPNSCLGCLPAACAQALPTVLWYVDLWLPGGWGILLYRHKETSSENQSPLHPWANAWRQVSTCFFFLKGFGCEESARGTYKSETTKFGLADQRAWKAVIPAPCGVWESQCCCQSIFPLRESGRLLNNCDISNSFFPLLKAIPRSAVFFLQEPLALNIWVSVQQWC